MLSLSCRIKSEWTYGFYSTIFYEIDDFHRVGIRAELSRPISYNDKNVVNSFSTRLILDINGPEPIIQSNDAPLFTPDIDLDIIKVG